MYDKLSKMSNPNDENSVIKQLLVAQELLTAAIEQLQQDTDSPDNFGKNLQEEHPVAVLKKSLLAGIR